MHALDLVTLNAPKFSEYVNSDPPVLANDEFVIRVEFSSRDTCLDWQVYVHEVYRMKELRKVYKAKFRPLKNTITWLVVGGPRMIHNLILRRVYEGRPRKRICFLNEIDMCKMCGLRRCRLCGVEGYSRSRCPHRGGSSIGGNARNSQWFYA
ncbi:hypothetical protein Ahy_A06g029096 [Arachis hypogaea]|uniref:CCHC-type domain-containing protein n=1 Tax=Arachis hypogaea TaxID=3818 RepID=A0A445CSF0_ARAHY|nr:hypothetical protein Ahy_A06g029096 [Arachis hypogaea]